MKKRGWAGVLAAGISLAACAPTMSQQAQQGALARAPANTNSRAYADFLIGRVANLSDDYQAASDRYFEALVRDPHNQELVAGAVTAALASGDYNRARQIARMAPRQGAPAYVHIVRANDALAERRWRQVESEAHAVEGSASEELMARMLASWARAGEGHVEGVSAELRELSAVRHYGALIAYQQAMALDIAGREQDALMAYSLADAGELWIPATMERHADLLARTGSRDQAIALLTTTPSLQYNPSIAASVERLRAGGPASTTPLDNASGAAITLYGLAAIYADEHDTQNRLVALTLSLALDPRYDSARLGFAETQAKLYHYEAAHAAYRAVAPDSVYAESAQVLEAWLYLDEGREAEAVAQAQASARSGGPRARRALGDIYRRVGRYEDADGVYSQLIEGQPNNWRLYYARGVARQMLDRWPEGEADMRHALELSPEQADVLNYLAFVWVDRGEHLSEALAMIERAVALQPNNAAYIDSLGWAYYRMGRYQDAQAQLEHAVDLLPSNPILNDHLGDVYWRIGRRLEARFQWNRALSLEPENPDEIRRKLENGLPPLGATRTAGGQ